MDDYKYANISMNLSKVIYEAFWILVIIDYHSSLLRKYANISMNLSKVIYEAFWILVIIDYHSSLLRNTITLSQKRIIFAFPLAFWSMSEEI